MAYNIAGTYKQRDLPYNRDLSTTSATTYQGPLNNMIYHITETSQQHDLPYNRDLSTTRLTI